MDEPSLASGRRFASAVDPARIALGFNAAGKPFTDHPVADLQRGIERAGHAEADDAVRAGRFARQPLGQSCRVPAAGNDAQARPGQHLALALQPADDDYMPQASLSELAALRLR